MEHQIQLYSYNGKDISFELENKNVMINATEMAQIFGKLPKDFLKNEQTKLFIIECLKKENSPYLNVQTEDDLVTSKQKSGTWMHRVLALKFAAWLNPGFEFWVYSTIDQILFGAYKHVEESLKESAKRKNRIDELKNQLQSIEIFQELELLELQERQASYSRGKLNRNQLNLFRDSNY